MHGRKNIAAISHLSAGDSLGRTQEYRCSRFITLDLVAQPRNKSFHAFAPDGVAGNHEIEAADMRHSVTAKRSAPGERSG